MIPAQPLPRTYPPLLLEARLSPGIPPSLGAATTNNPPLSHGSRLSRQPRPEAPLRCPSHRTYLSPMQSHPHSTVLPHSVGKHPRGQPSSCPGYEQPPLFPIWHCMKNRHLEQFCCQTCNSFSLTS